MVNLDRVLPVVCLSRGSLLLRLEPVPAAWEVRIDRSFAVAGESIHFEAWELGRETKQSLGSSHYRLRAVFGRQHLRALQQQIQFLQ